MRGGRFPWCFLFMLVLSRLVVSSLGSPVLAPPVRLGAFVLLLAGAVQVQGQSLPSAASILRQQEAAMPPAPLSSPVAPAVQLPPLRSSAATGGARVQVRSLRVSGGEGLVEPAVWSQWAQPLLGQTLDSADLLALAEQVTGLLRERGWLLAQAFLPPQDVTAGDIEIRILPGALEGGPQGIAVTGAQRVSAERIRRSVASALIQGGTQSLQAQQLEEGLLRAAELAGVSATASLERGAQSGTSRLTIEAQEAPLASGSLTLDNFGSPFTGVNRLTGLLMLNSPLGLGDSLMLNLVGSSGIELMTTQWGVPVSDAGLRLGGSLTALQYRVGGPLADLQLQGRAQMTGLNLSQPLFLSQALKLRAKLAVEHKAYTDKMAGALMGDKRATVVSAGLSGQSTDGWLGGGMNDASLGLDQGHMDLSRLADTYAQDQAGPRTHGRFHKGVYAFTRLQPLAPDWSAQWSINGQVAGKNLNSSEKFSLGGNSAIRAYPGGEGVGDSGWVSSLTLRHALRAPLLAHKIELSGFVDWGRITVNKSADQPIDSATGANRYGLAGAGLGLALNRVGAYRLNMVWAQALGSNPGRSLSGNNSDGKPSRSRLLLSLNVDL